jgi:hypothetical protein
VPRRFRYPFDWRAVARSARRGEALRDEAVLDQLIERDRALEDHLSSLDGVALGDIVQSQQSYGLDSAPGGSAVASRADHLHGTPGLGNTVVTGTTYGLPATAGTGLLPSRIDHAHGTPPPPPQLGNSVVSAFAFGQFPTAGFSTFSSRADHSHGSPVHGATDHVHPSVSVYRSGNIFCSNGVETSVVWNVQRHNTGGMWDGGGTLIAPISGVYLIWCVNFWQVYPTGQRTQHIKVNGLTIIDDHQVLDSVKAPDGSPGAPAGGWGIIGMSSARTWRCNAGDGITVTALQQNVDFFGLELDGSTGGAFGIEAGMTFLSAA